MTEPLLLLLPLVSSILWLGIGVWPLLQYRFGSPIQWTLTAAAILLGLYALVDWMFFQLTDTADAIIVSELRASMFTLVVLFVLLAAKWIYLGHSRIDPIFTIPSALSLLLVWGGMTTSASFVDWGPQLARNTLLYVIWVGIQVAYIVTAAALTLGLYRARGDLAPRLRKRIFWSTAAILGILAVWGMTNVYNNVAQAAGIPWFSSLLSIPAAIVIAGFLPLSPEEIGEVFRGLSGIAKRISAVYVFYRTGEPLVALGASRSLPVDAEQLQGIIELVGNFVETSMRKFRGYAVTAMRFERLGILAVRGKQVIVAALYEGTAYDALRSELLRALQDFETRRGAELTTLEGAARVAEELAEDLSALIERPTAEAKAGPAEAA